jgi:sulfite reductase (NADPH) hemoprotein beta-component
MHAIQTSGNCIRNITTDHFAGAAADEIEDPRPYGEILRQWSSIHPEYSYLPRKFKIALNGAPHDRAAIQVHDLGFQIVKNDKGEVGFSVYVGGGQGRTPLVARKLRDFLPKADLLAYSNAILRIYNLEGRRDNKYRARVKILVEDRGIDDIREEVEADFAKHRDEHLTLPQAELDRIAAYFALPPLKEHQAVSMACETRKAGDPAFARFLKYNVVPHKKQGYGIVTISLKPVGGIPGDASAEQMEAVAGLAEAYSQDEIRVAHEQNLVLPHVALDDLPAIFDKLVEQGLAEGNIGLVSDIIACPGLDYCALATARSIPIAQRLSERFGNGERAAEIGPLKINVSGCINACGHHHVGHIGILGLDKKGVESYQIALGGSADETCEIGQVMGPGFSTDEIIDAIEKLVDTYLKLRTSKDEDFLAAVRRVGMEPFQKAIYFAGDNL